MLMITPETIPDQYVIRFTCLEHNQVIDQHHFFSLAMQPIACEPASLLGKLISLAWRVNFY